jgi:hypothetical protein
MSLIVKCPHSDCGRTSILPEGSIGLAVLCPHCRGKFLASSRTTAGPIDSVQLPGDRPVPAADLPAQIGRFQVRARLGEGAFGTVYRAHDPQLDREVALKVPLPGRLDGPQQVERFLREARAAARLRHPHIVPLFEASGEAPHFYLASAFIQGRTLAAALAATPFDFRELARVVRELAEALAYAHGQGIVHRDVKPANVMLDKEGAAHLLDFGLAHRCDGEARLTLEGGLVGTPAYVAPEQIASGSGEVLAASDQYSLGVLLYELLCRRTPFEGPTEVVLFNALHTEPPPPRSVNRAVPYDLEKICLKAMAKRPQDRYAGCQEMADDLGRWIEGQPLSRAKRFRWPAAVAAAALFGALAVAGVAVYHAQTGKGEPLTTTESQPEKAPVVPVLPGAARVEPEQVAVTGLAGTFTLTLNGQTTTALPFDASAAEVERALEALPGIGGAGGAVTVSRSATAEVQQFAVKQRAGTFCLAFKGKTTAKLPFNATAEQVQTGLNGLASIADVGGAVTVAQAGNVYVVTFRGRLGSGQQPLLTVSAVDVVTVTRRIFTVPVAGPGAQARRITGPAGAGTTYRITAEVQQFTVNQRNGTFQLTFDGHTTPSLPFNATAALVQAHLNALPSINRVGSVVTVAQAGNVYTVTFQAPRIVQWPLLRASTPSSSPVAVTVARRPNTQVQEFTVNQTTGQFRLLFRGQPTAWLPFNATADRVQTALNALPTIRGVGTTVTVSPPRRWGGGNVYTVTFLGRPGIGQQPLLTGQTVGAGTLPRRSSTEVQEFIVNQTTGTFRLSFNGHPTAWLPFNATAEKVQDALNALPSIRNEGGSVTVSQADNVYTPGPRPGSRPRPVPGSVPPPGSRPGERSRPGPGKTMGQGGNVYTVTFQGLPPGIGQLPRLTVQAGGAGTVPRSITTEVQELTVNQTSGTFHLTFKGDTTTALPFNATANEVQTALNDLASIRGVGGLVTVSQQAGNVFTIAFAGNLASGQQPLMTASPSQSSVPANEITRGHLLYVITFPKTPGSGPPRLTVTGAGGASVTSPQRK